MLKRRANIGFTLVELMILIALAAIVIVLLLLSIQGMNKAILNATGGAVTGGNLTVDVQVMKNPIAAGEKGTAVFAAANITTIKPYANRPVVFVIVEGPVFAVPATSDTDADGLITIDLHAPTEYTGTAKLLAIDVLSGIGTVDSFKVE